tara:strand:+ start:266 stop:691 length:426 start_codon:yes stop_codon:yes gene_type:complete
MNNNNVWGPSAWTFLHTITYNYPENPTDNDKKNYHNFFMNLQHVLPCKKCQAHYTENIQKYDLNNSLDNRDDLVKWLIDIHNEVNKHTGKRVWTYSEVYNKYDNLHNTNLVNKIIIFTILCIVLVLIFFLYKTYGKKGCNK